MLMICYVSFVICELYDNLWYDVFNNMFKIGYKKDALNVM